MSKLKTLARVAIGLGTAAVTGLIVTKTVKAAKNVKPAEEAIKKAEDAAKDFDETRASAPEDFEETDETKEAEQVAEDGKKTLKEQKKQVAKAKYVYLGLVPALEVAGVLFVGNFLMGLTLVDFNKMKDEDNK